ncbi:MAG: tripartite motif-containing protein 71 [Acidobacteriota bacterium]|jgi:DNA-directed RNA polymerase subunit RPC12/RpoP|nr:tripartite motif-containing protein 71 [Acidobacteriota bacterium]
MEAFNCPQCGAALEYERIESATVRCHYCNSLVVVPPELRPSPARTEPQTSYRAPQTNSAIPTAILIAILTGGLVLLVVAITRSKSKARPIVAVTTGYTPRLVATPAPTSKPEGYTVAYTFGGEGTGPGLFKDEMGVAVDAAGHVYVSDETRRVQRFDAGGQFLDTWSIPTETKWYSKLRTGPRRLMANSTGEVFAVLSGVLMKFEGSTGEVLGAAHGTDYIQDAALVLDGRILIVSQKGQDDELVMLGNDGRAAHRTHRFVSSLLDKKLEVEALRVTADNAGETYALYALGGVEGEHWYDNEDLAVFKFSPEGRYIMRFGGGGHEPGQFGPPSGLAADNQGRVYVSEPFDQIHVYSTDGRYLRTLKAPHAVEAMAFDMQDNLYVAGGKRVSKLVLDR